MKLIGRTSAWFAVACLSIAMTPMLGADVTAETEESREEREEKDEKSGKSKRNSQLKAPDSDRVAPDNISVGRPLLWEEPADIEQRDLFHGPGGRQGAPDPESRFIFLRKSTSGSQKKIIVKDDAGREWTVKFGPEARPETTATRFLWAAGYHVDQNYFVERARIEGYEPPDVRNVRFERQGDGFEEAGTWSWESNPFVGTRELDGLKVLIALLKNWDLKTSNNKIVLRETPGGSAAKRVYYVSDLGATLGATGSFWNQVPLLGDLPPRLPLGLGTKKGKGHPEAFSQEDFIKGVRDGEVEFNHERKRGRKVLKGVTVENARWMGNLLARLSDKQLADAFRAGGFNDSETAVYQRAMRERIRQLQQLDAGYAHRRAAAGDSK
jgi:hypothetical protein